jgi:cell division control protein 7
MKQGVNVRALDDKIAIYERLRECLKIVGNNKIGTESYMPMESILHHNNQTYESDIWPVGIILLQFVLKKYNIFNHLKTTRKLGDLKNTYFIYYFMEIATIFGKE